MQSHIMTPPMKKVSKTSMGAKKTEVEFESESNKSESSDNESIDKSVLILRKKMNVSFHFFVNICRVMYFL